jgi:Fur family zinc uptake transcriptional regulator
MPTLDPAEVFASHNHAACAEDALARAEELCAESGARLTPVRRRTLEILLETHKAMGAYDVLERLAEDGFGHQPPVAYRAIDFLVDHGLVHRIQRLNAFTACTHAGGHKHAPVFMICETCHVVAEAPGRSVQNALERAACDIGFAIERAHVEALGLCPACSETNK